MSYFSFLIFLVFCLNAGLFVWFNVPETKNRTVAEISAEFQRMHSKATLTMEATATSEPTQTMETTIDTTDQQILSAEEDTIATKL